MKTFTVTLTNVPDAGAREFPTLAEAKDWMKHAAFESACWQGETMIGMYSPLYGWRDAE